MKGIFADIATRANFNELMDGVCGCIEEKQRDEATIAFFKTKTWSFDAAPAPLQLNILVLF